jgi:L-threonylcarbamoyladenylate synthase
MLGAFGGGVAAPSANRFGRVSPTTAADVRHDLGDDVDLVVDGGPATVGVESTIVDCSGAKPTILRIGAVTRDDVEGVVGRSVAMQIAGEVAAPGTLPSHYAPTARVVPVARDDVQACAAAMLTSGQRVGLLALDPPAHAPDGLIVLDPPADVDDYARVLYARLRQADDLDLDVLLTVLPSDRGIGAAVADRLRRASA